MLKRSGFAKPLYDPPKRAPARPATRRAVLVASNGVVVAKPKPRAQRNAVVLELAKGKPCLLMVPGVCQDDRETTVAAHANWSVFGKSMGRKADDQYTVWACHACHVLWLDQGSAPADEKRGVFKMAMLRQKMAWFAIAISPSSKPWEKGAAQWALNRLKESE